MKMTLTKLIALNEDELNKFMDSMNLEEAQEYVKYTESERALLPEKISPKEACLFARVREITLLKKYKKSHNKLIIEVNQMVKDGILDE